MEPKYGGRDLDNQERELEKAWKRKPNESSVEDLGNRGQAAGRRPQCPSSGRSEKDRFRTDEVLVVRDDLHVMHKYYRKRTRTRQYRTHALRRHRAYFAYSTPFCRTKKRHLERSLRTTCPVVLRT